MKILIFSDSHRNVEPMITAAAKEEPNVIIHLGDVESDAVALRRCIPGIMICSVPGNCDFMPLGPHRLLINLEGKTIFAAHGHTYGVKSSYASIINAAMAARADILLFGHTHQALEMESMRKSIFRTAETLENKGFLPFSYACLSLKSANGY